jgi:hypothetical protein
VKFDQVTPCQVNEEPRKNHFLGVSMFYSTDWFLSISNQDLQYKHNNSAPSKVLETKKPAL